jgi:hypothetical protein
VRRAGAAASVSLTIAVAVATSVVVAGILAGPAILACAKSDAGAGSCLRAKAEAAGWLPNSRQPGQVKASAAEATPARTTIATLSPPPGTVGASAVLIDPSAADATLSGERGSVAARAYTEYSETAAADVGVAKSEGGVLTSRAEPISPSTPQIMISALPGQVEVTADPAQVAAPTGALLVPASSGIDAIAMEQAPPLATGDATLAAGQGAISGSGDATRLSPLVADVAANPERGLASADGNVADAAELATGTILSPAMGSLAVSVPRANSYPLASITLVPTMGSSPKERSPVTIVAARIPTVQALAAGLVEGSPPASASALLVARPPTTSPITAAIDPPDVHPPIDPPAADPPEAARGPVLKPDPRYPNFVILQMPRGGAASVVTLQVK